MDSWGRKRLLCTHFQIEDITRLFYNTKIIRYTFLLFDVLGCFGNIFYLTFTCCSAVLWIWPSEKKKKKQKTRYFLPFCTGILDILGCALGPLIFGFNLHRLSRLNFGQDHPKLQDFTVNTMKSCFSGKTVQIEDIGVQSAQTASKKHQQSTSCTRHFLLFKALLGNHQNCTFCLKYSKHFFYLCVADYE